MTIYQPLINKYYKWYMSICSSRKMLIRNKENYVEHHIIPDCFFIKSKRRCKDGWLEGNPDEPVNLVLLTEKEHFIVHWLLCKCYEGLAKRKMCNAFKYMCYKNKEKSSKYYKISLELWKQICIGKNNPNWKGGSIKSVCGYCLNEFFISRDDSKNRKYCSRICANNASIAIRSNPRSIPRPINKIELICKQCGTNFYVFPYKKETKFCSRKCFGLGHHKRKPSVCIEGLSL